MKINEYFFGSLPKISCSIEPILRRAILSQRFAQLLDFPIGNYVVYSG